jgi:predicted nucleotidyltransferase
VQEEGFLEAREELDEHELREHVIYRALVGSRAYGLSHEGSDHDVRGVYLAPAHRHWSLFGVPGQLENRDTDEVYWELEKFILLALKANPNILEVLFTDQILEARPLGIELRDMRVSFLSQLVFQTYGGYVQAQFRKLQARISKGLEINWKHAMHLIRLLLAGTEALRSGHVPVRVADEHRERLLEIRGGESSLEAVDRWRLELQRGFEQAYAETSLPSGPTLHPPMPF